MLVEFSARLNLLSVISACWSTILTEEFLVQNQRRENEKLYPARRTIIYVVNTQILIKRFINNNIKKGNKFII